ncbi:MAG: hypothetical protein JWP00_2897 [Chloroflexi bacterium]|jgi:hypothetical protein|nr:hypothetical protein [Chloroflexota bacterium]
MNNQMDPEFLVAKYKQHDFELRAKHLQMVREAKQDQTGWLDRLAGLRGKKVTRSADKSKALLS